MLAKCVNDEQMNWSQQLPYVMMAYRTSVHESTGYTPHFLVYGQEDCLSIDFMYPNPSDKPPADLHEFVSARQVRFQKAYESARTALNFNQRRRNALYNRKVQGPTYQVNQKVLLPNPVVPVGKSPKFFSPWKGPYVILQCLNDVTYCIQEIATRKELVVHYDRLKLFHEPPPTSKVPTRDKRNPKNISQPKPQQQEPSIPSTTMISVLGIIRTIPSLQQPLVLAALLAQPRLLRGHQQLLQLVPPNLYYRVPLLPILERQHPIAMALPAHRRQPLLSVQAHLHLNLKHLQNHQLTPEAFLAALPRRLLCDQNHGSAKSLTMLLVLFSLVMHQLKPNLNVTSAVLQKNNAKPNHYGKQNYLLT